MFRPILLLALTLLCCESSAAPTGNFTQPKPPRVLTEAEKAERDAAQARAPKRMDDHLIRVVDDEHGVVCYYLTGEWVINQPEAYSTNGNGNGYAAVMGYAALQCLQISH